MTQQTQGTPGDTTTGTDDTARNQQTRSADDASTQLAAARDTRAAAERELERLRDLRLAAQRERAEHRVEVDLAALGGRVSPAMTRRGLRAVMVELAAAAADDEPTTLQLAGADGTTTEVALYDALHQALAAAPDTLTALASEMAGEDPEAPTVDPRDPATRKVHLAAGLTDDRVTELAAKYGEDAIFGGPRSN